MHKIPVELKKAICEDNLILFIGAGLSYDLININKQPLKGWAHLVECILTDLISKGHDLNHLLPLVNRYEPIKILDLIESEKSIPKKEIYSFTKDFFDLDPGNNVELQQLLFQLSGKIITTNYDNAFEIAVPELRKNKAYKGKNYELTTHKDSNSVLLFKLHGCFEDIDSMVLFPTNYKDLYENTERDAEHSLLVLKNIIVNKSVLFIGTGMGDFQINNIFEKIRQLQGEYNQDHFIITNKALDSSLSFLTPVKIDNYSEITAIVEGLIAVKKECRSNEQIENIELRKQLEEAHKKIDELENTTNKDELLERESLKYFRRGVEFSLSEEPARAAEEYKIALELKPDLYDALNNWGNDLGDLAKTKQDWEAEDLYNQAFDKFQKALDIKPDFHEALNNWGIDLGNLAQTKQGQEAEDLYNQAIDKFQKAIDIKPDFPEALHNWGTYLGNLAQTQQDWEAEDLYNHAIDKFQKAVDIKPDYHQAFNNWGTYLGKLAKTKQDWEAEDLYNQAFDKYQKAIDIKPDDHQALFNWGTDLGNLAQTKQDWEAEDLYNQAFDKYQKAIDIKPDDHKALYNWGTYLGKLAKTKQDWEAVDLYNQAIDKLQKAIDIKPDDHQAFDNWGTYLGNLAQTKQDWEAEDLYNQAFDKFQKAIEHGASSYNLSCILALKGELEKALKYLEISLSKNEIDPAFVENDEDWKQYFGHKELIDLLNKFRR